MTTTLTISQKEASQRITVALFIVQSLFSASIITMFTLSPIIGAELGGGDRWAGLPSTMTLIGRAAFAFPIGWLMDKIGRRDALALGYLIGVLGAILAVFSISEASFLLFLVSSLMLGLSRGATEQGRFVAAEVQPSARRAKAIGWIVFAGTIGSVGGPGLVKVSGRLSELVGLTTATGPFLVSALLLGVAVIIILALLHPDPLQISREIAAAEGTEPRPTSSHANLANISLIEIFRRPMVQLAVIAMLIGQLVMTFIMVITPVHMNHHSHAEGAIANVIMAHTLGMFGLSWITGWLIDRVGRIKVIGIGAAILVVSCLTTPLSSDFWPLAISLFLLGLGWNFCFIAGSSLLSDSLSTDERARAQGSNEVLVAIASATGSVGTGFAFEWGGIVMVSAFGLAMALVIVARLAWSQVRPQMA